MRVVLPLLLATAALAAPEGRNLRPEEHWRPAAGRDLSKYKPRGATVSSMDMGEEQKRIDIAAAKLRASSSFPKKSGSSYKGSSLDLRAGCGVEGPLAAEERIVGGVEATEHAWPWQVALFIDDAWFCGGSIISENYVLTAAHCADGAGYFDVMAGAHNVRASNEDHRVEITSYNGWTHPGWNTQDLSNDLALIELPEPLPMNDYITTSCLPVEGDTPAVGSMVSVTGWGKPSDSAGGISDVLREVRDIPVMSNADCNAVYGICGDGVVAIDTTGGRGSCNGDSGGPLIQKADGQKSEGKGAPGTQWKQVGIVSFGSSAGCEKGSPAGFTRTEYYLDWILSETGIEAPTEAPPPTTTTTTTTTTVPTTAFPTDPPTTTTTAPPFICPDGWLDSKSGCFKFLFTELGSRHDALLSCEMLDGYLAEPSNSDVADYLAQMAYIEAEIMGVNAWWIGLTDQGHEGRWVWEHSIYEADFTNWADNYPMGDAGDKLADCALMNGTHSWQWVDADCSHQLAAAICQIGSPPAPGPSPTTTTEATGGETTTSGGGGGTTTGTTPAGQDTPASERCELVGGSSANEGNVWATNSAGVWGAVCDDGWDANAADVVCKQLGYSGAAEVFDHSEFGDVGSDDFSYDETSCSGSESHIQECQHDTEEDCYGGEAAGVRCS